MTDGIFITWPSLDIPQGATINSVVATLTSSSAVSGDSVILELFFVQLDNAGPPKDDDDFQVMLGQSGGTQVTWGPLNDFALDEVINLPDLTTSLQAVIDRTNWERGNQATLILKTAAGSSGTRTFYTSRAAISKVPKLTVSWTDTSSNIDSEVHLIIEQGGDRYEFAENRIYKNEQAIALGQIDAEWSAIKYNSFNEEVEQVFALNGTDRKRISSNTINEWGIEAPDTAPTMSGVDFFCTDDFELTDDLLSGLKVEQYTRNFAGDDINYIFDWELTQLQGGDDFSDDVASRPMYNFELFTDNSDRFGFKYTYVRRDGETVISESNPSPATVVTVEDSNAFALTWTNPTDSQVTHIGLYRTLANVTDYFLDSYISASDSTFGVLRLQNGELGSLIPSDHVRPPLGGIVVGPDFDGNCFIAIDNKLRWCIPKQPEYWPVANEVEIRSKQFPILAMEFHGGLLHVLTAREIHQVQGTGGSSFLPVPLKASTGTKGKNAVVSVRGFGLVHVGSDALWNFNGAVDKRFIFDRFSPIFRGEATNGIPGINRSQLSKIILEQWQGSLYFCYPSAGNAAPDSILKINMETGRVQYYTYELGFTAVVVDETNDRLLIGDEDGRIIQIEDLDVSQDLGSDISWEVEGPGFTLSTRKHYPRWAKYDIDASAASSVTGEVLLDGASIQSHTVTGDRQTNRRLIETKNGGVVSLRMSGSGPVEIFQTEME